MLERVPLGLMQTGAARAVRSPPPTELGLARVRQYIVVEVG